MRHGSIAGLQYGDIHQRNREYLNPQAISPLLSQRPITLLVEIKSTMGRTLGRTLGTSSRRSSRGRAFTISFQSGR
jgi:hypothetical protein